MPVTPTAQTLAQILTAGPTWLQFTWFLLVGLLFTLYAVLDGFDLGVGILHLAARTDAERRALMGSIGPVWDGNEVYLITGGGALFAAFPDVYATVFSGFYLALILLLLALILRAVSLEFRSKEAFPWWRRGWDLAFHGGSLLAALLLGVALGNIARGLPLDADHEYAGGFFTLLNPYALLVGLATVALFAQQGALYLVMKTEGPLQERLRHTSAWAIAVFTLLYGLVTLATLRGLPHMTANYARAPLLYLVPGLTLLLVLATPWLRLKGRDTLAFLSSSATVAGLMGCLGIGIFPNMVRGLPVENSLSIANASSSPGSQRVMLVITALGMPLVLAYSAYIYWVFRGKVREDKAGY
jgi:cytochrome d ubiquinol oxidase subunit II